MSLHRWRAGQLLVEERVRVRDRLLDRARQASLERVAVARSEDASCEGVDRAGPVAGSVTLNRRRHELAHEARLVVRRRHGPRRLHEDEGVHRFRGVQCQLEGDHRARGMADDVRPLDPEPRISPAQCAACSAMPIGPRTPSLPANPARW